MNGQVIYQPGTGFINGAIKPFNAALINSMMASMTNSNTSGNAGTDTKPAPPAKLFALQSLYQMIVDATTEQIIVQAQDAAINKGATSPPKLVLWAMPAACSCRAEARRATRRLEA